MPTTTTRRPLPFAKAVAFVFGILLTSLVSARPAEATGITFSQFVSANAAQIAPPAGLPAASPSVARWGWSGQLPGGYTPAVHGYALDVLRAILNPATLPTRSTVLLAATGESAQPERSVWLLNAHPSSPRVDAAFLARELQVAIWKSLYDGSDGSPATGVAAARTVRYLSALYRLPVGDQTVAWHAVVRNDTAVSSRADRWDRAPFLLTWRVRSAVTPFATAATAARGR